MPPIDLDRLRLKHPDNGRQAEQQLRVPRAAKGELFLRGPIPVKWLSSAARLPGKALHAGIAIWLEAGLRNSAVVPLSNISGQHFGLDRNSKYRALSWLEGAGLIRVERRLGRAPVVTILNQEPLP